MYSAAMPSTISGTVFIRLVDTDRTQGKRSLDTVFVDYMYIESSSGPVPPVANFVGNPTSGVVPLIVAFTDLSTGNPTSWSWTFGDGGTSSEQNPVHEYSAVGVYTVSLTAENAYGSDTKTEVDYITVTESGCLMHVHDMSVSRKEAGLNCSGLCTVWVYDQTEAPLAGATVYVTATGPVGGSYSGTTIEDGSIDFETGKTKSCSGEWCFEVTDVTHSSCVYDSSVNNVTEACESGWLSEDGTSDMVMMPDESGLDQNCPNPFNPSTDISFRLAEASQVSLQVFDARGRRAISLIDGWMEAGYHSISIDASELPSGVYFCRLKAKGIEQTRRIILTK
jgi:PKD repeat protein